MCAGVQFGLHQRRCISNSARAARSVQGSRCQEDAFVREGFAHIGTRSRRRDLDGAVVVLGRPDHRSDHRHSALRPAAQRRAGVPSRAPRGVAPGVEGPLQACVVDCRHDHDDAAFRPPMSELWKRGRARDAHERVRVLPRVRRVQDAAAPERWRLLRILLVRFGAVSANPAGEYRLL